MYASSGGEWGPLPIPGERECIQAAVMSLLPAVLVYVVPLLLVMAAIAVAIVLVVIRLSRKPGAPGAGTPVTPPEGMWNTHIRRDGHLDPFSGFGTLRLQSGMLTFVPDGASQPAWSLPSRSFGVQSNFVLSNSDLMLDSAATGRLQVTVSREGINRVSRNNFKTLRERDTSGEFIRAIRAAGATILS